MCCSEAGHAACPGAGDEAHQSVGECGAEKSGTETHRSYHSSQVRLSSISILVRVHISMALI